MKVAELCLRLLPGSCPLLLADDGTPSPQVAAMAGELPELFMCLSADSFSEPQACVEKCARLLSDLPRYLCTTWEKGSAQPKCAEALPSFIWLGMTNMPMLGPDDLAGRVWLGGRVWLALRVLGRLISAASTEEELRPVIAFPACEFTGPLVDATDDKLALASPVGGRPCYGAYQTWCSCLLSARAELAVLGAAKYRMVPKVVVTAFEAAARALEACSENRSRTDHLLLYSAARLLSLTTSIADRAALPAPELQRMLGGINTELVMCAHIRAVQGLRQFVFSAAGSGEGYESVTLLVNPDTKVAAMLDLLRGVLSSLLVFLGAGMLLEAFIREEGLDALLRLFQMYTLAKGQLVGPLEHKYEEVLLVAAECLVALIDSDVREMVQREFVPEFGFQHLLDTVDALPLARLVETFLVTGRLTLWQLQCAVMRVLDLATLCSYGRAELLAEGGIKALVKAARLYPDKPAACSVPDDYKQLPQTQYQKDVLKDLLASVAAHAFSVVGQVCVSVGMREGGLERRHVRPFIALAGISSLEEMEQLLELGDVRWAGHGGRPRTPVAAKVAHCPPLRASVILCTHGFLGSGVRQRKDFMQHKYKELFRAHLECAQNSGGGGTEKMATSLVYVTFANILGERAAWRRDLLQHGVHLLAGATLTEAVVTLKHETPAGRKARMQKPQARGRGGACACGRPGCTLGDLGASGGGPELEGQRTWRVRKASILLTSSLGFLTALKEAGKEGQQAALEVLGSTSLAEAAIASPPLSSVSPNLKGPEASLKEWLAWGEQLVQQSGGKRTTQLDAVKAAEAAAAALLAEEEEAQGRAAAKTAKRQRQKAAKQQAKQQAGSAQQLGKPSDAQRHGIGGQRRDAGDADTTHAAGEGTNVGALSDEPGLPSTQDAITQRSTEADTAGSSSLVVFQEVEATSAVQLSDEGDTALRQTGSRGGSQRQTLLSSPYKEQASSSQEVPAGRTAGRVVKLKKLQKPLERQQPETPSQNGSLLRSAADLLHAAPAGKEPASPALIPATAAILGPAPPPQPATNKAAAVTVPATPPRPVPPALPPPPSAEVPLLAPAPLSVTVSKAAPTAAAAAGSREPVACETPNPVLPAQAAEAQVVEYQALLDYLLPGVNLSECKPQAKPTSHEPATPASNGSLPASSQASNGVPPDAPSKEVQQQQACHPAAGLGTACSFGSSSQLPPSLEAVLVCRLSGQPLRDPVIAADGYTYERDALTAWLQLGKLVSPATGRPFSSGAVRANFAVRDLVSALWVC